MLPRPARVDVRMAQPPFVLTDPVRIVLRDSTPEWAAAGEMLAGILRERTGYHVTVQNNFTALPRAATIVLQRVATENPEGYTLEVHEARVTISASTAQGARWGAQTLRQLLPTSFESAATMRRASWRIPPQRIVDAPRFAWRGTMLDAARHFLPVADVKRHLDLMARYKLNVLHWHLTDDQGWRIEITRFPELTRVGAWRREADGSRYGGFYTQAEIREVVAYAAARGITVVPEIELPGHSVAAIASYPALGCTGATVEVPRTWGVFAEILCAGSPVTFEFLTGVLDEVLPLFPAPYVHIGGDEVPKDRWRACESCQAVIRREGLKDEEELQRWMVDSIGRFLAARGKRLIGWNEIMHGGRLQDGTMVQSWESAEWTTRAATAGYDVIASPNEFVYLNHHPGELSLTRVYGFEPVPPGLDSAAARRVRGSEAPFWSEHILSRQNLELLAWPRLLAFSEVLWSSAPRDTADFLRRAREDHVPRLVASGVQVGPEDRDLLRFALGFDAAVSVARIEYVAASDRLVVRATRDGSAPTASSPTLASGALLREPGTYRLQAFVDAAPVREERRVEVVAHRARGTTVRATPAADARYAGTGPNALTDGLRGSESHHDGTWHGWLRDDVQIEIPLAAPTPIREITVGVLQSVRSWIVLPRAIEMSWTTDGRTWTAPRVITHDIPPMTDGATVHRLGVTLPQAQTVRGVRVTLRSSGPLPAGHPGAGRPSWIFADEIEIR